MVDMQKLTHGVLHTKFWVVDQTHFYLGSANMDWRSLTQVCVYPARLHCQPPPSNFRIHPEAQPSTALFLQQPRVPCESCWQLPGHRALEVLSAYPAFIVHSLCVFEAHL